MEIKPGVVHQGNYGGFLVNRQNPLTWTDQLKDGGDPFMVALGANSRPRDLEDWVVFDGVLGDLSDLSEVAFEGLEDLGFGGEQVRLGELGAFGIKLPDPFAGIKKTAMYGAIAVGGLVVLVLLVKMRQ